MASPFLRQLRSGSQQELEQALSKRLEHNAAFFQSRYPNFYRLLTLKPHLYQLVVDERGFNIANRQDGSFVYPIAEGRHQMYRASEVLADIPLGNPKWKISSNAQRIPVMDANRFPDTAKIVREMIDAARESFPIIEGNKHLPHAFLPVTTLFGLGGGLYLEMLRESHLFIHALLIFEELYDFFRISCCFIDYPALFEQLGPKACFLFVQDIPDRKIVKQFFADRKIASNFTRLELSLYETPKMAEVRQIVELEQASNSRGWGTFEDEMIGVRNSLKNIDLQSQKLAHPVLTKPTRTNVPVCVVGNGPSLDELLPFLKANQDKMIIFSAGTALKPLCAQGIRPDFQIEIERLDYLPDVLEDAGLSDIPLLAGNIVHPRNLEIAQEAYLFLRGSSSISYANAPQAVIEYTFPFVGNAALSLASLFSEQVLLCGLDMGYKEGRTKHASGSMYGEEKAEIPKDAVKVKGNFSDDIYADSIFALSREVAEILLFRSPDVSVHNLSDGAYIKGTHPTRPESLELPSCDKQAAIQNIKQSFQDDPTKVFGKTDRDEFDEKFTLYRQTLLEILQTKVSDKKEFFHVMDQASGFIEGQRRSNPFIGVLLGSSLLHVFNAMFILMMHVQSNEIGKLHHQMCERVMVGLDLLATRYRFAKMMRGVA